MPLNLEEHAAKALLHGRGVAIPEGQLARSPEEAARAAGRIGPSVVKAQIPSGRRGKAGGIKFADTPEEAAEAARQLLGATVAGHRVGAVLLEQKVDLTRELYLAVINDPGTKGPLLLLSPTGGMEVEELVASPEASLVRHGVDIRSELDAAGLRDAITGLDGLPADALARLVAAVYDAYIVSDAELVEVNPLGLTAAGELIALDAKVAIDESAAFRQEELAGQASTGPMTDLERAAAAVGLRYVELDGPVGILANGAGLTMATMDMVTYYGGKPANFLEIGGDAYTKGRDALKLVLDNPRVRSLLVNFCGAFARTDVMTEGIVAAWEDLKPDLPASFSVRGTGEDEAMRLLRQRLNVQASETPDAAVIAAVEAAR